MAPALVVALVALAFPTAALASHAFVSINDVGGANDLPGQKDLTRLQVDDSHAGTTYVNWNWDEVTGFSGANTGDACALFDTDQDGLANYAICVTIQDDINGVPQQTATSPRVYSCESPPPNADDRCTGSVQDLTISSTATVSVQNTDPFAAGDDFPFDTVAELVIQGADVGGGALLNVCSYPSQIPNSAPSDCIITPGAGFLTIVKDAGGDTTAFDFTLDPAALDGDTSFTASDGTPVELIPVDSSETFSLSETVPNDWVLDSASCDTNGTATGTFATPAVTGIDIQPGQETVCTFVDSPAFGLDDFSVEKTADPTSVPEPGDDVTFTVTVSNTFSGPVDLTALVDNVHGDLDGQGSCVLPQTIAAGDSYTCSFTAAVNGDAGDSETDTVTATVEGLTESDDAKVDVTDVLPTIEVDKTADPTNVDEPGDTVSYTVRVDNTTVEAVTLTSLIDDLYGDLDGQGDCLLPQNIAVGDFYTCTFTAAANGDAGDTVTDTVTATANDNENNPTTDFDDATVTIDDVLPTIEVDKTADPTNVDEPGDTVSYTVRVDNTTVEAVTLTSLIDDLYGDLDGQGDCLLPQNIAVGDFYTCTFTAAANGDAGDTVTDTVTATANDNENNPTTDFDDATVTIDDVLPTIEVDKTADPTNVDEPGDTVSYTVRVDNTTVEAVTLTSLIDDLYGDLDGQGDCLLPQNIAVGDFYTCTFTAAANGDAGDTVTDTVTATANDNENNPTTDFDDATVTIDDVLPTIEVDKTADPTNVDEPGDTVSYTVRVDNTTVEAVTLTSLIDDLYGDLDGQGDCLLPQNIAVGDFYTCTFTAAANGDAGDTVTDTVTATANDNENNPTTDFDDATVTIDDVLPTIEVDKTADPTNVDEPGDTVSYTVRVDNTTVEAVTLTSLIDDLYGDLNGQGDCLLPQNIAVGDFYTCTFTAAANGDAGDTVTDTVTATANDNENNPTTDFDDATVTIDDVLPTIEVDKTADPTNVDEPGDTVSYTVRVDNTTVEAVTLTSLIDDLYGDLNGQGDCLLPQNIAVGDFYTCTFTAAANGDAGDTVTDTVTATANDNENNPTTDFDDATVTIDDVLPTIEVDKTADPTNVDEPGDTVSYTVRVDNTTVEAVTLTSLIDDLYGDLNGQGDCLLPQNIAVGDFYTCTFTAAANGDAGDTVTDTVTATANDNENNPTTDFDDATVTIDDVLPTVVVTKSASPTALPFGGGTVTYTITVENTSPEPVTLTSLTDNVFGDLHTQGTCAVPQTLAASNGTAGSGPDFYSCSFSKTLTGDAGTSHSNTATAVVEDNEGNTANDSDTATVSFTWRGRTPGYWKNHPKDWPGCGVTPKSKVVQVFNVPSGLRGSGGVTTSHTLLNALAYKGGNGAKGAAHILLRASVAAYLNECQFGADYPPYDTVAEVVADVNGALGTQNRDTMLGLATVLDFWNNGVH